MGFYAFVARSFVASIIAEINISAPPKSVPELICSLYNIIAAIAAAGISSTSKRFAVVMLVFAMP